MSKSKCKSCSSLWWILGIVVVLVLLLLLPSKSKKEGYTDPIFLNRYQYFHYYPEASGLGRIGADFWSGYTEYPKAY